MTRTEVMPTRYAPLLAIAFAASLWSVTARAQTFSLSYAAPPACPGEGSFETEVGARVSTARRLPSAGAFHFDIELEERSDAASGRIKIQTPQGRQSLRSVDGANCAEVVSALALIAALTLDPRARLGPIQELMAASPTSTPPTVSFPESRSSPEAKELPAEAAVDAPALPAPRPAEPSALPPPPDSASRKRPVVGIREWELWGGVHGGWYGPLAPGGMLAAGPQVEWRTPGGPLLRFQVVIGPKVTRHYRQEAAEMFYDGVEFEPGWELRRVRPFGVAACLLVSAGRLTARADLGGRVMRAESASAVWVGLGPGVRLRWAQSWGALGLRLAVAIAIVQPEFQLMVPETETFHRVPRASVLLGLEGSMRAIPFFSSRQ